MVSSAIKQTLLYIYEEWWMLLVLTAVLALYLNCTSPFDFFEKKGIAFMKPTIFFGNLGSRLMTNQSSHEFDLDIYNNFKGKPFGGVFEGPLPVIYVFDPDLIKAITVRDFEHFNCRKSMDSKKPKYLSRALLNLTERNEWKDVRSAMTPAFSSACLRNMLPLVEVCGQHMVEFLKQYDGKNVEMNNSIGHFVLEVIGTCALGFHCDASSDENAHLVKVTEKVFYLPQAKRLLVFALMMVAPKLLRRIDITFLCSEACNEIVGMLKAAVAERRLSGLKKNDFLQHLIEAAEKEKSDLKYVKREPYLDDDTIDAQSLFFLLTGYKTISILLSFAIHVLATKPDIQADLRTHIKDITDGKEMNDELLSQLHYLEGFLLETLRMYPPVGRFSRVCTKKYNIPGTSVTLDVGNVLAIPVYGIHMDPDYYPDPHEFKPERFMHDEKRDRHSHVYLPFGAGPRKCVGYRFAMTSAKVAMICLLKNFKFTICEKTEDPVKFDAGDILLEARTGLWVRVEKI